MRDVTTLFLLLTLAMGPGCPSSSPPAREAHPEPTAQPGTSPSPAQSPAPVLTPQDLTALLEKSAKQLDTSQDSISGADDALEGWVNLAEIGEQLQAGLKGSGESPGEPATTRGRVLTLTETWGPLFDSLGTSSSQCESADSVHFVALEVLTYAQESKQMQELDAALAGQTPRTLEQALDRLAAADRELEVATGPTASGLARAHVNAVKLGTVFKSWRSSEPESKARREAAAEIKRELQAIDTQITAAQAATRTLGAAAKAHVKASLGLQGELRTLALILAQWVESLGEAAPTELRAACERLRLEAH